MATGQTNITQLRRSDPSGRLSFSGRQSVPALFCCQRVGGSIIPVLPGCCPYTCRAVQSLTDARTASRNAFQNRRFHFKASRSLYNRFYTSILSLYYHTTKRRSRPHTAPHSTRAKITRLANRQDGHYYWSFSGDPHQGAALGRLAPPRAMPPGALNIAQRAELESRIVDSRNTGHSRLIVDSRLIVASLIVGHSR